MAQIVCEICGSSEMIKKDGVFQCECCGMKYSLEEIRSMLGAAPSAQPAPAVFQTVPERHDDKSDTVAKYLQFARLAKSKEDWAESEKYYKLVEMEDPTNIEAAFYGSYGKAKASLMDSNLYQRQAVFKILHNVISMLPQNYNPARSERGRCHLFLVCHRQTRSLWSLGGPPGPRSRSRHSLAPIRSYLR